MNKWRMRQTARKRPGRGPAAQTAAPAAKSGVVTPASAKSAQSSAVRCPCFGQPPSDNLPAGTPCDRPPLAEGQLCAYHAEMFDSIDRRACAGLRQDMLDDGIPMGTPMPGDGA